jgi:putative transposase
MKPARGYEALRHYRATIHGASYFVTICTVGRLTGLNSSESADAITRELHSMETDGAVTLRGWVIMPDHLHLFLRATGTLTLGQVIGRLKAKTRPALEHRGLRWQGNYYEHRLRPEDFAEDVLRYLYLNPYRAQLVAATEMYPHFWLSAEDAAWFRPLIDDERPFPEWMM